MHMCVIYMNIPCNIEDIMHFSENQNLSPMTPNNLTFDPINEVMGLKVMHMYELHEYTM